MVAESKPFLCRPETLNLLLYCFWICLCLADRLPLAGAPDRNYTSFLFKTPILQASKMLSASARTEGVVGWSQPTSSADAKDTAPPPRKNILACAQGPLGEALRPKQDRSWEAKERVSAATCCDSPILRPPASHLPG